MQMGLGRGRVGLSERRSRAGRGEALAVLAVSVCMLYVNEYGSVWISRVLLMRRVFSQACLSASWRLSNTALTCVSCWTSATPAVAGIFDRSR